MRLRICKDLFLLYFFLIIYTISYGQLRYGLPQYKIISPEEYNGHPQTWDVSQIEDGRILIGTSSGLLIYDGVRFEKYLKGRIIRTLYVSKVNGNKRIYFGGDDVFGYMEKDSIGKFHEVILSDSLPAKYKDFIVILGINKKDNNTIYISGFKRLFIYKNDSLFKTVSYNNYIYYLFKVGNKFLVYDNTKGILEINDNDSLELLKNTEIFAGRGINYITPYNDDTVLIAAARPYQFYKYNLATHEIREFHTPMDDYFLENGLNNLERLDDKGWAIGTNNGGLIVCDSSFNPIFIMNTKNSLSDNYISGIFRDREGNIWFSTNNGFGVVYYNNKVFNINRRFLNVDNVITSVSLTKNKIYVGTLNDLVWYNIEDNLNIRNNYVGISKYPNEVVSGQVMDILLLGENDYLVT